MAEMAKHIFTNSIENAKRFLDNQEKRTAPNNRVNGDHYFVIANKGARVIKELLQKR